MLSKAIAMVQVLVVQQWPLQIFTLSYLAQEVHIANQSHIRFRYLNSQALPKTDMRLTSLWPFFFFSIFLVSCAGNNEKVNSKAEIINQLQIIEIVGEVEYSEKLGYYILVNPTSKSVITYKLKAASHNLKEFLGLRVSVTGVEKSQSPFVRELQVNEIQLYD